MTILMEVYSSLDKSMHEIYDYNGNDINNPDYQNYLITFMSINWCY